MPALRVLLVFLAGLLVSCATPEPPYVFVVEPLALAETPRLYVISNRDPERVVESLEKNGLEVTKGLREANLLLRVGFGADRKQTYECGQIRNVKYELRRANRLVLSIQGRGPTGKCDQNIVDQVSAELAHVLGE